MTRQILFILTYAALSSCSNRDTIKSTRDIKTKLLTSVSTVEIHKILDIEATTDTSTFFTGQYSYYKDNSTIEQLHGPFYFSYADSGSYEDIHFKTVIEYSGKFKEGKPIDLTHRILNDDGVDYYANWTVTLNFDSLTHNCNGAKFHGKIGYIMPDTTFEFLNPDTCTFQWVVDKAWTQWEREWTKRKNAH